MPQCRRRRAGLLFRSGAVPGHAELVLRVPDALLDLPAVGRRLAGLDARELGLRILQLTLGERVVDLVCLDGVVDERDRAVLEHLEEARTRGVLLHLAVARVDARRARLQHRDEWRVARQDPDLAGGAWND